MISTIDGIASCACPKNSRQTVRTCCGIWCTIQRADVISPSQPSFCTPGTPPRNLSVTSLPRPTLRNCAPAIARRSVRNNFCLVSRSRAVLVCQLEHGLARVVDLAEVMTNALDFEPVALGIDHAPPRKVVDCRAPQHGLLTAGVHCDIAADARCVGRCWIDCEHVAGTFGCFGDSARYDSRARQDSGHWRIDAGQRDPPTSDSVSSFSVLITAACGVSGMTPPV